MNREPPQTDPFGITRRSIFAAATVLVSPLPARAAARLDFRDIISGPQNISPTATAMAGNEVEMRGYMAPPLKSEINFFILTKLPAAVCPFCDSAAAWPDDIVLVQMARPIRAIDYDTLIRVTGTLETGEAADEATGFVSLVRLRNSRYVKA